MGVEVLYNLWSSITSANVSGVAQWLAVIGFALIVIVAIGYGIAGSVKLIKMISSMKIKEFSLLLLALGFALIGIAVVLP